MHASSSRACASDCNDYKTHKYTDMSVDASKATCKGLCFPRCFLCLSMPSYVSTHTHIHTHTHTHTHTHIYTRLSVDALAAVRGGLQLWSAESPNLYVLMLEIMDENGEVLERESCQVCMCVWVCVAILTSMKLSAPDLFVSILEEVDEYGLVLEQESCQAFVCCLFYVNETRSLLTCIA